MIKIIKGSSLEGKRPSKWSANWKHESPEHHQHTDQLIGLVILALQWFLGLFLLCFFVFWLPFHSWSFAALFVYQFLCFSLFESFFSLPFSLDWASSQVSRISPSPKPTGFSLRIQTGFPCSFPQPLFAPN